MRRPRGRGDPWSPLARGRLTRPWDVSTKRLETDQYGSGLYPDSDRAIVEVVLQIAQDRGVTAAQVALAWVNANPVVTAPIVGMSKPQHLADAIASLDLQLTEDEIARLEAPYTPRLSAELPR